MLLNCFIYESAFFLEALFGFAFSVLPALSTFLVVERFILALIAFLFLETPYDFLHCFPFLDFLSPFPMQ
jgi:hypothetical protein